MTPLSGEANIYLHLLNWHTFLMMQANGNKGMVYAFANRSHQFVYNKSAINTGHS